jgi:hypothetical protein
MRTLVRERKLDLFKFRSCLVYSNTRITLYGGDGWYEFGISMDILLDTDDDALIKAANDYNFLVRNLLI